jgi:hypothetical protein
VQAAGPQGDHGPWLAASPPNLAHAADAVPLRAFVQPYRIETGSNHGLVMRTQRHVCA